VTMTWLWLIDVVDAVYRSMPCLSHDCRSQLLFPVLSLSEASDSWRRAVSTTNDGHRPVTDTVEVWTAAAGGGGGGGPNDAVNVNNDDRNNDNSNGFNDDMSTNSPLASDDYSYTDDDDDDDDDLRDELQQQHYNSSQTLKSSLNFQRDNSFTGRVRALLYITRT